MRSPSNCVSSIPLITRFDYQLITLSTHFDIARQGALMILWLDLSRCFGLSWGWLTHSRPLFLCPQKDFGCRSFSFCLLRAVHLLAARALVVCNLFFMSYQMPGQLHSELTYFWGDLQKISVLVVWLCQGKLSAILSILV